MSDAQRLTWSLLVAMPLLFALYAAVRAFPFEMGEIAGPSELLAEPFSAPWQFIISLYAVGAAIGWIIGREQDAGYPRSLSLLKRIKLDPEKHRDIWRAALKEPTTVVYLQLTDGTRFYGWPAEHTSGLSADRRFVRLTHLWRRRPGEDWKQLPDDDYALICSDSITYMHFKPFVGRDPSNSAETIRAEEKHVTDVPPTATAN